MKKLFLATYALAFAMNLLSMDRLIAETISVTNANNDGSGSLRSVIVNASPDDVIIFDKALAGESILLLSPITITQNLTIQGLGADLLTINGSGNSQLFLVINGSQVAFSRLGFINGNANNGGAISNAQNSQLLIEDSFFGSNFASNSGGAIDNFGAELRILRSTFSDNEASSLGGAINNTGGGTLFIDSSTLTANRSLNFDGGAITNLQGSLELIDSTVTDNFADNFAGGIGNNSISEIPLIRNSIVALNQTGSGAGLEFGNLAASTAINSAGANLIGVAQGAGNGNTINVFNQNESDSFGVTDALLDPLLQPLQVQEGPIPVQLPDNDSPVIDGGFSGLLDPNNSPSLPCGYKDSRGLGRPQDGNGDGVFECDIGAVEVQAGEALTGAQTGAYFDSERSGEGSFVEVLAGGEQALIGTFSYTPDGNNLAWFVGVGDIVGNTIVADDILLTTGGVFGPGFDPAAIERTAVGDLAFIFPDCEASPTNDGRMAFDSVESTGFQDILVSATRLSFVLDCNGVQTNPRAGRSGSFFAPERNGEGIFVEWLTDDRVVVIWYTFDTEGNQFWVLSDDVTVDGNTVVANMVFPATTTGFGNQFNPEEVELEPWGSITLEYQPGCDDVEFSYSSLVSGFGADAYSYTRLTNLEGLNCDL